MYLTLLKKRDITLPAGPSPSSPWGLQGPVLPHAQQQGPTRLLHPQHLVGIWIGQDQYRLPLATLNEIPEPWR